LVCVTLYAKDTKLGYYDPNAPTDEEMANTITPNSCYIANSYIGTWNGRCPSNALVNGISIQNFGNMQVIYVECYRQQLICNRIKPL